MWQWVARGNIQQKGYIPQAEQHSPFRLMLLHLANATILFTSCMHVFRWCSAGCCVGANQTGIVHFVYHPVMPGYSLCLWLPDIQPCVSGETVSVLFLFSHLETSSPCDLDSNSLMFFCGEG